MKRFQAHLLLIAFVGQWCLLALPPTPVMAMTDGMHAPMVHTKCCFVVPQSHAQKETSATLNGLAKDTGLGSEFFGLMAFQSPSESTVRPFCPIRGKEKLTAFVVLRE